MTDTNNYKLLIAEPSSLISNILEEKLKDEGFKTFIFENEFDAFDKMNEILPSCILINKQLSRISGAQLCCLIKNSSYSGVPVIIYSSDEDANDFLLDNCGADEIVNLSFDKLDDFIDIIKNYINNNFDTDFFESDNVETREKETPALCAVNSMEKSRFYFNILRSLFDLAPLINDLDEFTKQLLILLNKICNFDYAVFVYNQNPFIYYTTNVSNLSKNDKSDFLKVCKSDFESNLDSAKNYSFIEKGVDIFPNEKIIGDEKFASYKFFPLVGDEFIGTIHIASKKKNFFKNYICDNILYFVEKASVMLDQALKYKGVTGSEKRMRAAFSRFVPIEIIDDLLASEAKKDTAVNEKRKVAILICDIRNFTTISEINEPENVVSFLNAYFTRMVEVIKKYGGTIDKFIGDAIMALFGAPVSYTDNAERALKAACEMTSLLPEISCDLIKIPEGLTFDIGTGVHYGEVIVGSIGCEDKSDYTVIGDSANLTSRLEGLTKIYGSKIIISQAVKDELKGKYNLLNVDTVKVKGKSKCVPVYRVDLDPLPENYVSNYSKGLSLYKNGAWSLALGYFEKAAAVIDNDKSSNLMIERCKEFIQNPPKHWEGAISLTSK